MQGNNGMAMNNLGLMYENGVGVDQDYDEAFKLFQEGANQGNPNAMTNLGFCYESGYGVEPDIDKAVEWYKKAADLGEENARRNLQNMGYY